MGLWVYGSKGNCRQFFAAHFWSLLQIFEKQTFMNQLWNFVWWFPFYHFDTLLAVPMNFDVFFFYFWGLEIKPCESRLEFVHPKKIKNKKQIINQQKKTTKEEEKTHCLQNHARSHGFSGKNELLDSFCDFHSAILLVLMSFAKKIFVQFFLGTGHEPKIVSLDFGSWSFDFGRWLRILWNPQMKTL